MSSDTENYPVIKILVVANDQALKGEFKNIPPDTSTVFRLAFASHAISAIALARKHLPDFIVLDSSVESDSQSEILKEVSKEHSKLSKTTVVLLQDDGYEIIDLKPNARLQLFAKPFEVALFVERLYALRDFNRDM